MAKASQAQEQTMEEILASIRRIISDDEARNTSRAAARQQTRPANNVSHLFAEPPAGGSAPNVVELPIEVREGDVEPASITQAFAEAMEKPNVADQYAGFRPEPPKPVLKAPPTTLAAAASIAPAPPSTESRRTSPLLSARSDAAVATAFNQLADTVPSKSRTIDGVVEDMLRPMLKTWLDNNLPQLVERMVREEIERVSRGRR
jgi:cell pole-organizing protein PopZ